MGKTTLVRQFGRLFPNFIEFNLDRPENKNIVEGIQSAGQFLEALSLMHGVPASEWKNTLLFIDEIQEAPKIIGFLRYLYEDYPELNVVSAGSLLEHSFKALDSFPVGRVNYMYLFPLNFHEYLQAIGNKPLLEQFQKVPITPVAHALLLKAFHTYSIIGGMPEVVSTYVGKKHISDLIPVYESIWNTYKDDVTKYATNSIEQKVIRHIIEAAPSLLDKRIKFQNFGSSTYKSREVSEAFRSLDLAKVIQIIYPCTQVAPPVTPDIRKSPRMQFLDTGLLNFELGIQANLLTMEQLDSAYKGSLVPHVITQELISLNKTSYRKPNFWVREKKQSSAEVDLVYPYQGMLIPIEVKSGAKGHLRSLHQFIDQAPHNFAVRFYGGTFSIERSQTSADKLYHLMNLPYYLGTRLEEYLGYFVDKVEEGKK